MQLIKGHPTFFSTLLNRMASLFHDKELLVLENKKVAPRLVLAS